MAARPRERSRAGLPPLSSAAWHAPRTAVLVRLPGGEGRVEGSGLSRATVPLEGDPAEMADVLSAYAREGIGHVQLIQDPITIDSVRALEPVLRELDRP